MKRDEQESYRPRLLELRTRLVQSVKLAEQALREDVVKPGDVSHVHTHPADQDVEGMDEQIAIAHVEEGLLESVEAALERIEAGTFGTCQQCGREIGRERLDAVPYAALCIDDARREDSQRTA
jgi:DnaK suppressor protein